MSMLYDMSLIFVVGLIVGCEKSHDPSPSEPSGGQPTAPSGDPGAAATRPCVEPVTEDEAIAAFARLEDVEDRIPHMCAKLVPELGAVAIGSIAYDVGCIYRGVLFRCRVYPKSSSRELLAELGWAATAPEQRVRLARAWAEQITFTDSGLQVMQSETAPFARAKQPFTAPTGETLPDGGVRVTAWTRTWGMEGESIDRREAIFASDGALVSKETIGSLDLTAPPLTRLELAVTIEPEDGRRTADDVERRIRSIYSDGVRQCHEKALMDSPDAAGKLTLELRVSDQGVVQQARVVGFGNSTIDECVERKAGHWRFDLLRGGGDSFEQKVIVELTMTRR